MFTTRVKLFYQDSVYSLGGCPNTYDQLLSSIRATIPSLLQANSMTITYQDKDHDTITLTTSESLQDAYNQTEGALRLEIKTTQAPSSQVSRIISEESINLCLGWQKLRSLFSIHVDGECRGIGILINLRFGMTTSKILSSHEEAARALLYFEDSNLPLYADPEEFFVISDPLSFFSFKSTYPLVEVQEHDIDGERHITSGAVAITLGPPHDSDIFVSVKWVELKESLGGRYVYQTLEKCGLAGSPLFDENWNMLGIQLTGSQTNNEASSCYEIVRALKALGYKRHVVSLIQSMEHVISPESNYVKVLQQTPNIEIDRVYGFNQRRDKVLSYNTKTSEFGEINFVEKLSEGTSLCTIPNGLMISGGQSALRRAWICFFQGDLHWFETEMPQGHQCHTTIYFEGKVYLIGGKNSSRPIKNCEALDYQSLQWENLPVLRQERSYPASCVYQEKIYVFGGTSGLEDLDTIEYFDGSSWKLYEIRMPCRLFGAGILHIEENIFLIFGGKSENTRFNVKLFFVNFEREKFEVDSAEKKLGVCSTMPSFVGDEAAYIFNNEGEVIKYCKHTRQIYREKKNLNCMFD